MSKEREVREKLKGLVALPAINFLAVVTEVDKGNATATVKPISGPELFDVRLRATIDGATTGVVLFPAVGSSVIVSLINNEVNEAYITQYSEVEEIQTNGVNLLDKINSIIGDLNTLKQAFTNWVVAPNDGGAALKTGATSWAGQTLQEIP